MRERVRIFFIIAVIIGGVCSCSAGGNYLQDGYYSAESTDFDHYGWKEYITICVSGGRIILVEYDAYNASGFLKSWDMDYMRVMNAANGIYPSAYARNYGGKLLANQNANDISHLSGATYSHRTFMQLAEAVLAQAHQGDNETSRITFKAVDAD